MLSQRATALTHRHRRELSLLSGLVARQMTVIAGTLRAGDIDEWWQFEAARRSERTVNAGYVAASAAGARYLRIHAAVESRTVQPVRIRPNPEQIATALRVSGPVAFKTHMGLSGGDIGESLQTMSTQLSRSAQRLALNGDRETVMATFADSDQIVGWQRITGGNPCDFCADLASRGAVYSKDAVDFAAHAGDNCSAEPLYEREVSRV